MVLELKYLAGQLGWGQILSFFRVRWLLVVGTSRVVCETTMTHMRSAFLKKANVRDNLSRTRQSPRRIWQPSRSYGKICAISLQGLIVYMRDHGASSILTHDYQSRPLYLGRFGKRQSQNCFGWWRGHLGHGNAKSNSLATNIAIWWVVSQRPGQITARSNPTILVDWIGASNGPGDTFRPGN